MFVAVPTNASSKPETIHMALAEVHGAVRIALPRLVEGELEMKAHEATDDQDESGAASGVVSDVLIVDAELPDWSHEATDRQAGGRARTSPRTSWPSTPTWTKRT